VCRGKAQNLSGSGKAESPRQSSSQPVAAEVRKPLNPLVQKALLASPLASRPQRLQIAKRLFLGTPSGQSQDQLFVGTPRSPSLRKTLDVMISKLKTLCGFRGRRLLDVVYSGGFGRQLAGRRVRMISYEIFWAWMGRDLGVRAWDSMMRSQFDHEDLRVY